MALGRGDLPHDLLQLVVEAALGIERGFWGCVDAGATFRSTGRRRTKPGRAVIAANRRELVDAERVVFEHVELWKAGEPTPAGPAIERFEALWAGLGDGVSLTVEWPSLRVLASS